ncbi:MAG TPA: 23S rRNA (guanosine(2251)-2'-O)-methyltransferase RlmB [Anaerolineales bacterium]|nr:23S rRNA (guanosine(2251)-2'-O)-methyltransferase RlmB [Anaerolineales bacterium]
MKEWVFGRNPVYEVLRAQRRRVFRLLVAEGVQEKGRLVEILRLASQRKVPVERAPRARLEALVNEHQGVALETSDYPYSTLLDILDLAESRQELPFVLILDTLQDPQNLGTLLRTGEIVGIHGVLLPFRHTATVTPAVVSASSGASEHLLIAQSNLAQAIAQLKEAGVWVIGLESGPAAQSVETVNLEGSLAVVVGSEGEGMRPLVAKSCDLRMHLPMRGDTGSYNAAVAGSIVLYLAWQARKYQ